MSQTKKIKECDHDWIVTDVEYIDETHQQVFFRCSYCEREVGMLDEIPEELLK